MTFTFNIFLLWLVFFICWIQNTCVFFWLFVVNPHTGSQPNLMITNFPCFAFSIGICISSLFQSSRTKSMPLQFSLSVTWLSQCWYYSLSYRAPMIVRSLEERKRHCNNVGDHFWDSFLNAASSFLLFFGSAEQL